MIWYLASPYKNFPDGPDAAFGEVSRAAGRLTLMGLAVYSPIVAGYYLEKANLFPSEWMEFDKPMLDACDGLLILQLPSWEISEGIKQEIQIFREVKKPIEYAPNLTDFKDFVRDLNSKYPPSPPSKPPYYTANSLLLHAAQIVAGDRAAQHGPKERNHQNIADLWNAFLGPRLTTPLSPMEVALLMALLKIARTKDGSGKDNPDSYIDLAGYAGVAGEIALNEGKERGEEL